MARIVFTHHAVEQFVSRHAPDMTFDDAKAYLEQNGEQATRIKTRTVLGQQQWELAEPRCILVVKPDQGEYICVTVLPYAESFGGFTEDEMEIIREASERHPPIHPKTYPDSNFKPKKVPPPKPVKPPSLKRVERSMPKGVDAETTARMHELLIQRAIVKDQEKTKRHLDKQSQQISKQKQCLRATIRYLISKAAEGDRMALALAEEIQSIEPGFVTDGFLGAKKTG